MLQPTRDNFPLLMHMFYFTLFTCDQLNVKNKPFQSRPAFQSLSIWGDRIWQKFSKLICVCSSSPCSLQMDSIKVWTASLFRLLFAMSSKELRTQLNTMVTICTEDAMLRGGLFRYYTHTARTSSWREIFATRPSRKFLARELICLQYNRDEINWWWYFDIVI